MIAARTDGVFVSFVRELRVRGGQVIIAGSAWVCRRANEPTSPWSLSCLDAM